MAFRNFKRRCLADRVYASDEARLYAQTKAEEVESQLDPKFPSFVKPLLQSHVTGGFWLVNMINDDMEKYRHIIFLSFYISYGYVKCKHWEFVLNLLMYFQCC